MSCAKERNFGGIEGTRPFPQLPSIYPTIPARRLDGKISRFSLDHDQPPHPYDDNGVGRGEAIGQNIALSNWPHLPIASPLYAQPRDYREISWKKQGAVYNKIVPAAATRRDPDKKGRRQRRGERMNLDLVV